MDVGSGLTLLPYNLLFIAGGANHSRPQSSRSFWPAVGIESCGGTRFSEHAQSIR